MDEGELPFVAEIKTARLGRQRLVVLTDGREFLFSDDAFEQVDVRAGMPASPEIFEALEAAQHRVGAHEAALRLLSHRPRSEKEMRTRLAMRGFPPDVLDDEIARLVRSGLLDDEKFARSWVEERRRNSPRGRRMVRYELLGRGIDPQSVDLATGEIDDDTQALELARGRARRRPAATYQDLLADVGGFLRRRGFDYEVTSRAVRTVWDDVVAAAATASEPGPDAGPA